ncbi:hypothetical protein TNIN_375481 [Trichonephila inaurata madagascariensis]|uniref:Uncharacterized protein n=1 Tax=Trichonephila inaurata madagascariensis TaxID=2747483 RepID=A0A8X7BX40_9ARAC|nr:hypothetical protein TNIN_375481 [Trichonephila inaurata madagascariensis]
MNDENPTFERTLNKCDHQQHWAAFPYPKKEPTTVVQNQEINRQQRHDPSKFELVEQTVSAEFYEAVLKRSCCDQYIELCQ